MIGELIFGFLQNFFMGFLFGVVERWNRKVLFGILVALVLFITISFFVISKEDFVSSFSIVDLIIRSIATYIGIKIGNLSYDSYIKNKGD